VPSQTIFQTLKADVLTILTLIDLRGQLELNKFYGWSRCLGLVRIPTSYY